MRVDIGNQFISILDGGWRD